MKAGSNMETARRAVQMCSRMGPQGGRNALTGSYIAGVVFGGLVLGPVIVATNARAIQDDGARAAVDKCLNENGFQRRELSFEEVSAQSAGSLSATAFAGSSGGRWLVGGLSANPAAVGQTGHGFGETGLCASFFLLEFGFATDLKSRHGEIFGSCLGVSGAHGCDPNWWNCLFGGIDDAQAAFGVSRYLSGFECFSGLGGTDDGPRGVKLF
jgi:hypothetical protein